jgi:hypothetical protein
MFDQPVLVYIDSSTSVQVEMILAGSGSFFTAAEQLLVVTGYELDCTVAACAPIATQ